MGTPVKIRARGAASAVVERVPSPRPRPLAEPPPGSGLKPVMGDAGVPILGHTLRLMSEPLEYAREVLEKYGTVSWGMNLGRPMVGVIGPDGLETVLANRDKAFSNEKGWSYLIGPFFERGVMLMDFEEHRHHRGIMQQAFKRERLVAYLEKMNPAIERGIAAWPDGSRLPPLSCNEAADARHCDRGLRRDRAGPGGRRAQQGLHRRRSSGDRP